MFSECSTAVRNRRYAIHRAEHRLMTKVDRRDFMYLKKVVCFRMKPFEQFKKVPYNCKEICIDQSEYGCNAIVNSIFLPLFKNIFSPICSDSDTHQNDKN